MGPEGSGSVVKVSFFSVGARRLRGGVLAVLALSALGGGGAMAGEEGVRPLAFAGIAGARKPW